MSVKINLKDVSVFTGLLASFLFIFVPIRIFAQVSATSYSFTPVSGSLVELTGGTAIPAIQANEGLSAILPLGFSFNLCGVNYTELKASSNGWLTFKTTTTAPVLTNTSVSLISVRPALFFLWDDLSGAEGEATYLTTGVAPNRVFTIQYKNWKWDADNLPTISVQVKLYETSNVIEYIYRQEGANTALISASIGISSNTSNNYLTLDNATAAAAPAAGFITNIANRPVTGQIFRFTPPASCASSTNLPSSGAVNASTTALCISGNTTLTLSPNVPMPAVPGISYQWQTATSASGPYVDITGALTPLPTYTTTNPITASAYFRCLVLCNNTLLFVSAPSQEVVVSNPGLPSVTSASRCGPGTLLLTAAAPVTSPNATLNWYDSPNMGGWVATGQTFNTPILNSNTTYYVKATVGSCESAAVPVTATVTNGPALTVTNPTVICNNTIAAISLVPNTAYSGYSWLPVTNLFADAAATVPYTGNSVTTVYMRTTNAGPQTYSLMAGDPMIGSGCTFADTFEIWSQPGNIGLNASPDSICINGVSVLSLDTSTGYYPGSFQWQSSLNGQNYTILAGATQAVFTTPNLTFGNNTYYRALVSAGTSVCDSPSTYIVITNPSIVNVSDSARCGPGTVTLSATTGGNSSALWYENSVGGQPIASGPSLVTPILNATTSYYVLAHGGVSSTTGTVGQGTLSGVGSYSPFSGIYGGWKHQFLIKADDLIAAGIPAGVNLNSLAFDVTSGQGSIFPAFAISLKQTTVSALTSTFESGLTLVRDTATHTLTNGINTFTFDNTFQWDGTSNILVQTCWSTGGGFSFSGSVRYDDIPLPDNIVASDAHMDNQTAAAICSMATGTTRTARPQMIFGYESHCVSAREEVVALIHPVPAVTLGTDIVECIDSGSFTSLDAGTLPNTPTYLWDDLSTAQIRTVNTSGTYHVTVIDQNLCQASDTINVTLHQNPVLNLGNDTSVCNGVVLTLDAGNVGASYLWNTGVSSQTIDVATAGTYSVTATSAAGCSKNDTIILDMQGEQPSSDGINVVNTSGNTYDFSINNPEHVVAYDWNFGDGSANETQPSPSHTYVNSGDYLVTVRLSNDCGSITDSVSIGIVSVKKVDIQNLHYNIYPNPGNGIFHIKTTADHKIRQVKAYNLLGQEIYAEKFDSLENLALHLEHLNPGTYYIEIFSDRGMAYRKVQILK